jgi:hypothetical protein
MSPLQFEEPEQVSGVRINPADILGHLLMVWAIEYIEHSPTRFTTADKRSDVIIVDLVDLDLYDDNNQPGYLARRQWWRQGRLIQTLREKIGRPLPMLVVMGKGTGQPGFAAPFELVSVTQDTSAVERANKWYAMHPDFKPSSPRGSVSTDTRDPWESSHGTTNPPPGNYQPQRQQPQQQSPLQRAQQGTSSLMDKLKAEAEARRAQQNLPPPPPNQDDVPGF